MVSLKSLATAAAAALCVVGCGSGQSSAQPSQAPGAPVTLKVQDYSVEQTDFHKQVAAEYHRLNPHITIDWTSIAQAQYEQTLPLPSRASRRPTSSTGPRADRTR